MTREMSLTEAKTNFPRIVKGVERREEEIVVTRNGRPAAVILNFAEFHRLKETVATLTDPDLMKQIRQSRKFYKKGKKGVGFQQVFGEPLA